FFQAEDGIRDIGVLEFRRVLFRSSILLLLQLVLHVLCCLHIGLTRLEIQFAALSVEDAQRAIGHTEYLFSSTHHSRQAKPASDRSEERRVGTDASSRWAGHQGATD